MRHPHSKESEESIGYVKWSIDGTIWEVKVASAGISYSAGRFILLEGYVADNLKGI